MLTFRDTGKKIELKGDLLKMITKKNNNVDLASLVDKNIMYNFAEEMYFDVRGQGRKSTRDSTLIKLFKSPGLKVSASGISNTFFLPSNSDQLCDGLKLLLKEKQTGNNFDKINDEIVAIVDKLLAYKGIFKKQHLQLSTNCNLLHE